MRVIGKRQVIRAERSVLVSGQMAKGMGPELTGALVATFLGMRQGDTVTTEGRRGFGRARWVLLSPRGDATDDRGQPDEDWIHDRTTHRRRQPWEAAYLGRARTAPRPRKRW